LEQQTSTRQNVAQNAWQSPEFDDHEQVCFFSSVRPHLRGVVAIHDIAGLCAVGGTRCATHSTAQDAMDDALRLSRAMSYKNAMADLPFGGGKAVLFGIGVSDRRELVECYAGWLNSLGGRFCTGEDAGFSIQDCDSLRRFSQFVAGTTAGAGDPGQYTAEGVFYGMQAAIAWRLKRQTLEGVRVAVQGVGSVGWHLCRLLRDAHAQLLVADTNEKRARDASREFGAEIVPVADIAVAPADIFAPCALGGVITEAVAEQITAKIVAGCANNQLQTKFAGTILHRRETLYAPDFVINAGGLLSGAEELAKIAGIALRLDGSLHRRLYRIHSRLLDIFRSSARKDLPPEQIAEQQAREILTNRAARRSRQ
jgi:leucine dehydrogenase